MAGEIQNRSGAASAIAVPPGESGARPAGLQDAGRLGESAGVAGALVSLIKYKDFRYLWLGTVFSSAGQWIQQVTLGWLVYDMTGSTVQLGLINGVRAIPFLLTGPLGGVIADRVDRRQLMMYTQVFLVVTTFLMGVLVALNMHQVWHLFVFTLLTGVAWSFNQPVRQALVANVVPRHDLANAVALNSAGFNMSRILGPSLGGLLILWFGAAGNFFVQSVGYVMVTLMVFLTTIPPGAPAAARQQSVANNMAEGARWVWANPLMRMLMMMALVPVVFALPYAALMPVFAQDVLGIGPGGLGLLLSAVGIGAFTGAMGVASIRVQRRGRLLIGAIIALGLSLIAFSFTRTLPMAIFTLALTGASQMAYMATNQTVLQMMIPDELRGRVMSIYMLNQGLLPLGAFLAGFSAHWIGAPTTVALMGMSCIALGTLAAVSLPAFRNLE
ncbi:MAG: MFS transporter [Chloroflexi bacterium]|nr:MFS transporter [Chloroflexota bacterium]